LLLPGHGDTYARQDRYLRSSRALPFCMTARMMSVGYLGRGRRVGLRLGLFSGFLVSRTRSLLMDARVSQVDMPAMQDLILSCGLYDRRGGALLHSRVRRQGNVSRPLVWCYMPRCSLQVHHEHGRTCTRNTHGAYYSISADVHSAYAVQNVKNVARIKTIN
jgi:hypothetical protein